MTPPAAGDPAQAAIEWSRWFEAAARREPVLRQAMLDAANPPGRQWLDALFGNSPHLTRLALQDPDFVISALNHGTDTTLAELFDALNREDPGQGRRQIMTQLRIAKRRAALLIGLADIAGIWTLAQVTGNLSRLADISLSLALSHLLRDSVTRGDLRRDSTTALERGVIILGMGKLGAEELNYSSDIDLIILFDPDLLSYCGRDSAQAMMARLTRDLVRLMEERTSDGYVFRTDLRLRPDPSSTPLAVSVGAAESYYTSVGQNWERAALIKARPVAGDIAAGTEFLTRLAPFIWRKHLDFAAIRDIHSIKRQIDARQGDPTASLGGYNVKLGHGGIREIEFFAQTQQLIWGGRLPQLRQRGTIETLGSLASTGRIEAAVADDLSEAYEFLRQIEHRLQMIDDNQTHTLPQDPAGFARVATFLGYDDADTLSAALRLRIDRVQLHFRALFPDAPSLAHDGNLVFTGKESDPETLATLTRLGFQDPERLAQAIRGWHHGRIRATRSARARELLTELMPSFLKRLAETAQPDTAFMRFDEFLSHLPASVQLLSLFQHRPELFGLLAEILGESPLLSRHLARRPSLLDAVLAGDFFAALPDDGETALSQLRGDLAAHLSAARDFEDTLNLSRRWASDGRFQIGVHLLQGRIRGERAGRDFALIAEAVIAALLPPVEAEFTHHHGTIQGGRFIVLALGKLGSREMNVLSDLDLVFIYDAHDPVEQSDGPRPLPVATYFARLAQRMINALSALTAEGGLYPVDMRLRPSGNAGPIASALTSFRRYYDEQAWSWELMALTRGRVIAGDPGLAADATDAIRAILTRPRDPSRLLSDVATMRNRIAKAHPRPAPWDSKHRRGALLDLEFIAQYLALIHAPTNPAILDCATDGLFDRLSAAGFLEPADATLCREALRFWHHAQQLLRVSLGKVEGEDVPRELLDHALARASGIEDRPSRQALFDAMAARVLSVYDRIIAAPAALLDDHQPRETPISWP
jgi:glutamate-ammonia-ligase adenylyltransferase